MSTVEVVFLGLNDIGERVYDWLTDRNDVAVLALLTERQQLSTVPTLDPDLIVSAGFRHIVPEDVLSYPEYGTVNFHKAYLPYNRGANPNVWSIVEDEPAGVTLHYMTDEVDAGPIIDRRRVDVYPDDSARSLYDRLEDAQFDLFTEVWPDIRDGAVETTAQDDDRATSHRKRDFVDLWELDRDERVRIGDLLDRLRALTFPPCKNAYYESDGRRYYVEIEITPEERTNEKQSESEKNVPRYSEEDY